MNIRYYIKGEEYQLFEIFYSSIHMNAKYHYSKEQLEAWAPNNYNLKEWIIKIQKINPFVILVNNIIIGYADLQDNGYIDHFFIRGGYNNKGYGSYLLKYIINTAKEKNIKTLESDVSLSAQKLFLKFGFKVIKRKKVIIKNQKIENVLMRASLKN